MAEAWHLPGTAAPLGRVNTQLPTLPALSQSLTSPSAPRSLDVNIRTLEVRGSQAGSQDAQGQALLCPSWGTVLPSPGLCSV